ncbi:putative transposase (fragment) [Bradyrhizobium sp. ORS 285]|uniref:IS110 family transposase n=1 Tax=Bradyrhizobium sp. ORS 285 TaxID=115808 RepID=UPI000240A02A
MKLSAALDTSSTKTAICVVNSRDGVFVFEASVLTDPAIIFEALAPYLPRLDKVGHEAGSVAPWLHRQLVSLGLPMVLLETRQAAAALEVQRNKTDKNDARGLAHLARAGWYRPVHVKSQESPKIRLLLGTPANPEAQIAQHRERDQTVAEGVRIDGRTAGPARDFCSTSARVGRLRPAYHRRNRLHVESVGSTVGRVQKAA